MELVKVDYAAAQRHLGNTLRAAVRALGPDKRLTAGDPGTHTGVECGSDLCPGQVGALSRRGQ